MGRTGLLKTTDGGKQWIPLEEPTSALGNLSFSDTTHGLGVSLDNGLWKTSDAGTTWGRVELPEPAEAACATSDIQWAVGNRSIYSSSDGGSSWKPSYSLQSAGEDAGGNAIQCNGTAAWVSFDLGGGAGSFFSEVVRTSDGGSRWDPVLGGGPGDKTPLPGFFTRSGPFALVTLTTAYLAGECSSCEGDAPP